MPRYTIDRFEGTGWAVLADEQGTTFLMPRRWLPANAREGDVVIEGQQVPNDDTVSLRLELEPGRLGGRLANARKPGER